MKRTNYCGLFCEGDVGRRVTAAGWVQTKRDMGGVIFIDLRDREGTLQVVFNAERLPKADFALAEGLKNESVIEVSGLIRIRDEETRNPKIATGTIELGAESLAVLSEAQPLPFAVDDDTPVREDLRLKFRFLDIRRPLMYRNLKFRHETQKTVEGFLESEGFLSVETPILTKSTPEGARDYLVPSRLHPGAFYALPQSPQIFKQLLMVGGVDRYYQVARCFRDEDLRADRQPEFTQIDIEMSFVGQEDILCLLERLFKHIFTTNMKKELSEPFVRLTWQRAMDVYGSDKPDLRFDLPIVDLSDIARNCGFSVFRGVMDGGGTVRAINAKNCAGFTRGTIEELTAKAVSYGAKGMAWIAVKEDGELYSVLTKYFEKEEMEAILKAVDAKPGDFILFCADSLPVVRRTLGSLRLDLGDMLDLRKKGDFSFLIVTDFPQFEFSEEDGRFTAMHHPFTMPCEEDIEFMLADPARVRSQSYDFVLNGIELGSGSIRIHQKDVQQKMFRALGFSEEEIEKRFGFMVNAFKYGTPPHGGFAFGLDRLVMLMTGADSLREIIAFPKMRDASCLMTNAPDEVDEAQLDILGLGRSRPASAKKTAADAGARSRALPRIDVDNVANLARLNLTGEEKADMQQEMAEIIGFADRLSDIDTEGVLPTAHVVPMQNVFRRDETKPSFDRDAILQNTPTRDKGYVYVPKIVE